MGRMVPMLEARRSDEHGARAEVCVLGAFRFQTDGGPSAGVLGGSQRLLALLSLRDRLMSRVSVAGTLWPEATGEHAFSSLRSALARLSRVTRDAVDVTPLDLGLADGVVVDIRDARALAYRLLDRGATLRAADVGTAAVSTLSVDVLPDWYDDWVLMEAEEWRQLRLHALESLAERLLVDGRYGEAMGAALASVRAEPLRESARAAVIRVHLAEGNQCEALREFSAYRTLLNAELGLEPTANLGHLVASLQRK
jgi:DNA-binding SARP family transcriptional activator